MTQRSSKQLNSKDKDSDDIMKDEKHITLLESSDDDDDNVDLKNQRMYTTYCTITVKLPKNSDFVKYLHAKYAIIIDILHQVDEKLLINQYDPKHSYNTTKFLHTAKDLPTRMPVLQRFVAVTTRWPKPDHGATIWANIRISHDSEFEDIIIITSFDLKSNEMNLMSKRIQAQKSSSPGNFHFICNQADPDDVYNHIISDIGNT